MLSLDIQCKTCLSRLDETSCDEFYHRTQTSTQCNQIFVHSGSQKSTRASLLGILKFGCFSSNLRILEGRAQQYWPSPKVETGLVWGCLSSSIFWFTWDMAITCPGHLQSKYFTNMCARLEKDMRSKKSHSIIFLPDMSIACKCGARLGQIGTWSRTALCSANCRNIQNTTSLGSSSLSTPSHDCTE